MYTYSTKNIPNYSRNFEHNWEYLFRNFKMFPEQLIKICKSNFKILINFDIVKTCNSLFNFHLICLTLYIII